jgi:hypothetical protein
LESAVFWIETLCSSETTRRFGKNFTSIFRVKEQTKEENTYAVRLRVAYSSTLKLKAMAPPKLRAFSELHPSDWTHEYRCEIKTNFV